MEIIEKGHIVDSALEEYALNHLSESDLEVVEEHILICPACQDRLTEVDEFIRAFRAADGMKAEKSKPDKTGNEARTGKEASFSVVNLETPAAAGGGAWKAPAPAWHRRPIIWAAFAFGLALAIAAVFWWPKGAATGPAQSVQLMAQRGGENTAQAAAGRLVLNMDLRGLPGEAANVEIVGWDGRMIWSLPWSEELLSSGDKATVRPDRTFPAGQYWVRIRGRGASNELLREFGLRVVAH